MTDSSAVLGWCIFALFILFSLLFGARFAYRHRHDKDVLRIFCIIAIPLFLLLTWYSTLHLRGLTDISSTETATLADYSINAYSDNLLLRHEPLGIDSYYHLTFTSDGRTFSLVCPPDIISGKVSLERGATYRYTQSGGRIHQIQKIP